MLVVTVICSVRHDNMVEEVDAHELASLLDALCQFIVLPAWCQTSAGVVVAGCEDGCVVQYGFTHDNPYIYTCLGDTALAYLYGLDKAIVLIHQ